MLAIVKNNKYFGNFDIPRDWRSPEFRGQAVQAALPQASTMLSVARTSLRCSSRRVLSIARPLHTPCRPFTQPGPLRQAPATRNVPKIQRRNYAQISERNSIGVSGVLSPVCGDSCSWIKTISLGIYTDLCRVICFCWSRFVLLLPSWESTASWGARYVRYFCVV